MQVEMANIRNKVLEVTNDPNKTESQKESEIEALGKAIQRSFLLSKLIYTN